MIAMCEEGKTMHIEEVIDDKGNLIWNGYLFGTLEQDTIMFRGFENGKNELRIQLNRIEDATLLKEGCLSIKVKEKDAPYVYDGEKLNTTPVILTPRRGLPYNDLKKFILDSMPNINDYVFTDELRQDEKFIKMSLFNKEDDRVLPTSDEDAITALILWVESESYNTYTTMKNGQIIPINGGPITPSDRVAKAIINEIAGKNKRNFFIERIENFISKCDFERATGKGPICLLEHTDYDLFDRVGITVPELTDEEEEKTYKRGVLRWILCQGIELQINPEAKVDIAVVIHGPQDCGKSTLCRGLFKGFFTDGPNMDSMKNFVESLYGIVGVEIQETLKNLSSKNTNLLKALISMHDPNLRLAYGRNARRHRMRSVMIFTTNDPKPLTDPTGNRRYAPLHKRRDEYTEDPKKISEEDYLGYWAMMYKEVKNGQTTSQRIYEEEIKPYVKKVLGNFEDDPIYNMYLEDILGQYPNVGDMVTMVVIKDGLRDYDGNVVTTGLKYYKDNGFMDDRAIEKIIDGLRTNPEKWGFKAYKNNLSMNTSHPIRSIKTRGRGWLVRKDPIKIDDEEIRF